MHVFPETVPPMLLIPHGPLFSCVTGALIIKGAELGGCFGPGCGRASVLESNSVGFAGYVEGPDGDAPEP